MKRTVMLLSPLFLFLSSFSVFSQDMNANVKDQPTELVFSKTEKINVNYLYELMDKGNYGTAQNFIKSNTLSKTIVIEILKKYANQGLTPAMWMLGEAYNSEKDSENTANWIYAALLGTRIDSSLCINRKAGGIEGIYAKSFSSAVQTARTNRLTKPISFAIDLQKGIPVSSRKPQWVCSVVQHEKSRTGDGTLDSNKWGDIYKAQIEKFKNDTTTDQPVSPF